LQDNLAKCQPQFIATLPRTKMSYKTSMSAY
jgi:hypothetical protein